MPDQVPTPRQDPMFRIAGDGRDVLTLSEVRGRIRAGTLRGEDHVALAGSDDWKPAAEYAMLTRYFALVKASSEVVQKKTAVSTAPMGTRVVAGLAYPFSTLPSIVLIGAAFLTAVTPLLSIVVTLASLVYALAVIRRSSEGSTTAPAISETGGVGDWLGGILRVFAISLISAWPFFLLLVLAFLGMVRSSVLIWAAVVVMILYYPASLATVAVWKSIRVALSVTQIFRFISTLGIHYYAVIGIWLATVVAITIMTMFAKSVVGASLLVAINVAASMWALFYSSHLLGWAVGLHREQL